MSAGTQGTPADRFVWEVPGKPIVIHLSLDVVDQILPDVLRAFAAVPKRGAEVGGLLLGNVAKDGDRTIVYIEDCEMVPCEYKHGPSYLLSDEDLDAFDETCAKWEAAPNGIGPVGFYRSHTREGMSPEDDDIDLCSNFFPDPSQVLLLIKPHATKPGAAGFFFYENGRFQEKTYLEFPFRRRELSGQGPEPRRALGEKAHDAPVRRMPNIPAHNPPQIPQQAPQQAPVAAAQLPPRVPLPARVPVPVRTPVPESPRGVPRPEPEPELYEEAPRAPRYEADVVPRSLREHQYKDVNPARQRFRWVWLPLSFIFLLVGVVLGFQVALSYGGSGSAASTPEFFSLGLKVVRADENLSVQWDRNAPAVKASQRGVLAIDEGGAHKSVELDTPQLQTGSIIYRNSTDSVKFRLEVFPQAQSSVAETTSWRRD